MVTEEDLGLHINTHISRYIHTQRNVTTNNWAGNGSRRNKGTGIRSCKETANVSISSSPSHCSIIMNLHKASQR